MEVPVQVVGVSKSFRLGKARHAVLNLFSLGKHRLLPGSREPSLSTFWAVEDLNFSVSAGASLGVIGPNGAGKSTVLRLLAGILHPDRGCISVRGRLTALIEVGAGFHPDLTGRENIFLHGAILGMGRVEIRSKLSAIVDFAGVGPFLDVPVKRYSSGMYARLGFSIAAHVDPNVLLVDEVLSVGDAVFRLRCLERMRDLLRGGTTLIFVTHNLEQLQAICDRTIVLEKGRAVFDGPSREAVRAYLDAAARSAPSHSTDLPEAADAGGPIRNASLCFFDDSGKETGSIHPHRPFHVEFRFHSVRQVLRPVMELNLRAPTGERLASFNTGRDDWVVSVQPGSNRFELHVAALQLAAGHYFWNVRIWDGESGRTLLDSQMSFPIFVEDSGDATGQLSVKHDWVALAGSRTLGTVRMSSPVAQAKDVEANREALLLR